MYFRTCGVVWTFGECDLYLGDLSHDLVLVVLLKRDLKWGLLTTCNTPSTSPYY